jgi:hypothetical protein
VLEIFTWLLQHQLLVVGALIALGIAAMLRPYLAYSRSVYKSETGTPYQQVIHDSGLYGEYLTATLLTNVPGHSRILLNMYLPKEDGTTTEIDVLLIHPSGIYVCESKTTVATSTVLSQIPTGHR